MGASPGQDFTKTADLKTKVYWAWEKLFLPACPSRSGNKELLKLVCGAMAVIQLSTIAYYLIMMMAVENNC